MRSTRLIRCRSQARPWANSFVECIDGLPVADCVVLHKRRHVGLDTDIIQDFIHLNTGSIRSQPDRHLRPKVEAPLAARE